NRRTGSRAHGVGGCERGAEAVAAGVDEDASAAIRLAELLSEAIGIALDERGPGRMRETSDLTHLSRSLELHDDVKSFRAGGLQPACETRIAQEIAQAERGGTESRQVVRRRIEVEHADIGAVQVRRARRPDVRRDSVLVRQTEQRSGVADQWIVDGVA